MKPMVMACMLVGLSIAVQAQDPGMVAAQQAMDQQIQIQQQMLVQQQVMQQMQQVQQQQILQMQMDNAFLFANSPCWSPSGKGRQTPGQTAEFKQFAYQQMQSLTAPLQTGKHPPKIPVWGAWRIVPLKNQMSLSVPPGTVQPGTEVDIRWRGKENDKAVYYTTDGWSPNPSSTRYTGPITITGPTHLQVIAITSGPGGGGCPNWSHSQILDAFYNVSGAAGSSAAPAVVTDGVLHQGTTLKLVASAAVDSMAAKTGDHVPLQLDQDVTVGGKVVIPRGTPVDAVLAVAVRPQAAAASGMLVVAVRGLSQAGTAIPLHSVATMEGHPGGLPAQATIEPGMTMQATVTADVKLE
jgi:hypothetical protein